MSFLDGLELISPYLGAIIFAAYVYALWNVWNSKHRDRIKVLWTIIVCMPLVGVIVWWFFGPRLEKKAA